MIGAGTASGQVSEQVGGRVEGQIEGTLKTTSLPSLLTQLTTEARTGVVRIDGGSEIWLCQGQTYLAITATSPDLAKVLFDSEIGSADAIAAALSDGLAVPFESGAETAVDRLVAARPESEEPLRRLIHEITLTALFEMLVPSVWPFRFEPGVTHPIGVRFAQDTPTLIASARRRVEIWRRIAGRIPSTGAVFAMAPALPAGAERVVSADEWRFLAQLDGRRTVADLIADTGESAFRVCSSLYRLLLEEVIHEAA